MSAGMAQVWAANETSMALANTLEGLLTSIKRTFSDPDRERTAPTQLHALKMVPGMMAEEYMANIDWKDWLQQSSPIRCLCPRAPPIHPLEGLLTDIPPIWHGQLEGSGVQPRPPPEGVCQTETVDLAKLNTIPPDKHPHHPPNTGYLSAYGHR